MAIQKIPGRAIKLGTDTAGDVTYFDGAAWQRLPIGTAGQLLTMNETETAPQWGPGCVFPGTQSGYACYGSLGGGGVYSRSINKFSLVTDGDATDIGDLLTVAGRRFPSGHSSTTHGYVVGGNTGPTVSYDSIERFSFTTDGNSVDWADLISERSRFASVSSCTHGFTLGGSDELNSANTINSIQKFPFASETDATDWADATTRKYGSAGCSSATHGYALGGTQHTPPVAPAINVIENFPYASQTNATDVGDLTVVRHSAGGISSETHGYAAGGHSYHGGGPTDHNVIDRVSFATGGNATDHGDLSELKIHLAGVASSTHGYTVGGLVGSGIETTVLSTIDKFAFAANVTATDVGDILVAADGMSGHQF